MRRFKRRKNLPKLAEYLKGPYRCFAHLENLNCKQKEGDMHLVLKLKFNLLNVLLRMVEDGIATTRSLILFYRALEYFYLNCVNVYYPFWSRVIKNGKLPV